MGFRFLTFQQTEVRSLTGFIFLDRFFYPGLCIYLATISDTGMRSRRGMGVAVFLLHLV
jgi:hypothetical protein